MSESSRSKKKNIFKLVFVVQYKYFEESRIPRTVLVLIGEGLILGSTSEGEVFDAVVSKEWMRRLRWPSIMTLSGHATGYLCSLIAKKAG